MGRGRGLAEAACVEPHGEVESVIFKDEYKLGGASCRGGIPLVR